MNWLQKTGEKLIKENRGEVNLQAVLLMGIGFVFIAVCYIVFRIFMSAAGDLLAWTCTANTSTSHSTFTGFDDMVGIMPLLVLIGFLAAGVFAMYLGVRVAKTGGSSSLDLGSLILLAMAIIFLAIALLILPVTLEAICATLSNNASTADTGQGINSAFTGVSDLLLMSPMLLIVSLVGGAVVTGFFGLKRLGSS